MSSIATTLRLVVPDAPAAQQELLDRGVDASELSVITEADGGTCFGFHDPDGHTWAVQEIKARSTKPLIPRITLASGSGPAAERRLELSRVPVVDQSASLATGQRCLAMP